MIEQPNQSNPQGSQKVAGGRGPATPGCEVVCGSTPAGVPERCEDVSEKERSEIVRRSMSLWCSGRSGTPPGCGGFAAGYRGSLGATPGYRLATLRVGSGNRSPKNDMSAESAIHFHISVYAI